MKKSILITVAAVTVIFAVILTAGCVVDNTQQQTADKGTLWVYTDDTGAVVRFITMSPDGTGTYAEYKAETAENGDVEYKVSTEQLFSWTKEANGTINVLLANGEKRTSTIDENRGLLTSQSGTVYQQIPSELSGSTQSIARAFNPEDMPFSEAFRALLDSIISNFYKN